MTTLQDALTAAETALTDLDAAGAMFDALCDAKVAQLQAEAAAVDATIPPAAQLVREAETLYETLFDERRRNIGRPVDFTRLDHACRRALLRLTRRQTALHDAEWAAIWAA